MALELLKIADLGKHCLVLTDSVEIKGNIADNVDI